MKETGLIFIDLYTGFQKLPVIGLGKDKYQLLVRDSRRHNTHVHPAFGCQTEGSHHLIIYDQIGSTNIYIFFCLVDNVQIYIFTDNLLIQRCITEWLDKSVTLKFFLMISVGKIGFIINTFFRSADHRPHMEKHYRHIPDSFPLEHNCSVLPVSETRFLVDIFICKIDASRKSNPSVNNAELPVIPVILDNIQNGTERIKYLTFDSFFLKLFIIFMGKCCKTAKSVIDQAHINALRSFLFQNIQDCLPHHPIIDNEIFNKNIFLRLFQFPHKHRKHIVSYLKILCSCVLMDRKSGNIRNVSGLVRSRGIQSLQLLPRLWPIPQILPALLDSLFKMLLHDRSDPGTSKYKI